MGPGRLVCVTERNQNRTTGKRLNGKTGKMLRGKVLQVALPAELQVTEMRNQARLRITEPISKSLLDEAKVLAKES